MKKKIIIIASLLLLIILIFFVLYLMSPKINFRVTSDANCGDNSRDFYFEYSGRNVYTNCIENVYVVLDNEKYEIADYVLDDSHNFDYVFSKANRSDSFWDGGSIVYYYKNLSIISCNHLSDYGTSTDIILTNKTKNIKVSELCTDKGDD